MKFRIKFHLFTFLLCCVFSLGAAMPSGAATYVINPSDDGSLYVCSSCGDGVSREAYLLISGYIKGDVIFPTAPILKQLVSAVLSVNPYGLPLWGPEIYVYGFTSTTGKIAMSDLYSTTYLGVWDIPSNLGFGKDAFFDVTSFLLANSSASYVGFILVTELRGTDCFSSLEYNYGHPSQLTVATPLPGALLLFGTGLAGLGLRRRRKAK